MCANPGTFSLFPGNSRILPLPFLINQQERNLCLPVGGVDIESVGIVASLRFRNRTENSLEFASCNDFYIVVLIFLETAAPVFFDYSGCGVCLCVCGKIPVPGSAGVGCHEDIVSVAAIDNGPGKLDIFALVHAAGIRAQNRPGCDEYHVGPGTVGTSSDRADLEDIDMSVIQVCDPVAVIFAADGIIVSVTAVSPAVSYLIFGGAGNVVPINVTGCEFTVVPLSKTCISGFFQSGLRTGDTK